VRENTPIASVPTSSTANAARNMALTDSPLSRTTRDPPPFPRDGDRPAASVSGTNPALFRLPSGTADTAEPAFIFPVPTFKPAAKVCSGIAFSLSGSTASAAAIFSAVCPMPTVIRPVLDAPLRGRAPRQFYTWPKIRPF
jgi:hypothetical protein